MGDPTNCNRPHVASTHCQNGYLSGSGVVWSHSRSDSAGGFKGGAETLTHSARLYLQHMDKDRAFVKLDFTNAFNSIRRDAALKSVARHRPDLLAFVTAAYGFTSQLWMGDICIDFAEGVQQGDPLGPLLFCLALDDALKGLQCEFVSGYLDDIDLGDTVPRLINHIQGLETATQALGLHLNYSKCEVIGLSASSAHIWESSGFNFVVRPIKEACLLGSPLHCDGVDAALSARRVQLEEIVERLKKMSAHEALYLLKSCFAMPRLLYLLRTAPCSLSPVTCDLDTVIRGAVSTITNVRLDSEAWLSPVGAERCSQRSWVDGICAQRAEGLLAHADTVGRARLLASVSPGSGSWLHALPCDNLGLRLGNDELRVAVGLRLGAPLVRAHRCV